MRPLPGIITCVRRTLAGAGLLLAATAAAEVTPPSLQLDLQLRQPPQGLPASAPALPAQDAAPTCATPVTDPCGNPAQSASRPFRDRFDADPDAYHLITGGHGLTLHKPMFILPATYSEQYHGRKTEVLFDISLKQQLFGIPLYFGYTQKSFFDAYDAQDSKPFRESDYNPELFYRYIPADCVRWFHLGVDAGIEHESNGQGLPGSRSWNRLYVAPFQRSGEHVVYWKWWWRIPEDKSLPRTDPNRDDNPDITSYYGYSELHYEQQFWGKQMAHLMVRYNPVTGRGAASLQYSFPDSASNPTFFWLIYLWQGYGESLIDYNNSITRVGVGVALAR